MGVTSNPTPAAFYGLKVCIESDEDIAGNDGKFRIERNMAGFAAVHLCYVATQRHLQGQGVGGVVMAHALRDFAQVAKLTGICALTLVAINEQRAQWYENLGFTRYGKACAKPKMFYPAQSALDLVGG